MIGTHSFHEYALLTFAVILNKEYTSFLLINYTRTEILYKLLLNLIKMKQPVSVFIQFCGLNRCINYTPDEIRKGWATWRYMISVAYITDRWGGRLSRLHSVCALINSWHSSVSAFLWGLNNKLRPVYIWYIVIVVRCYFRLVLSLPK